MLGYLLFVIWLCSGYLLNDRSDKVSTLLNDAHLTSSHFCFCLFCWKILSLLCWTFFCKIFWTGHSYAEDQLDFSSMATVCTTTMPDRICLGSCRPLSSLGTWRASAMHSSWCWVWWASVPPCSLFGTYTSRSSVSKVWLEEEEQQAELYSFLVPLRSPSIEKVSSRVQQEATRDWHVWD